MSRPMSVVQNVPVTSGSTPKSASANVGAQRVPVRKSKTPISRKKSIAGNSSDRKMPTVTAMVRPAAEARAAHGDLLAVAALARSG